MEKAIVTFKDVDTENTININLSFDKEVGNLDYEAKCNDEYFKAGELGFIGILAEIFIAALKEK